MEDATAAVEATNDTPEQDEDAEKDGESSELAKSTKPKDKAAGYRKLLQAEAMQNRKRKRLIKGRGADNLVESEAEEDEEEDVLKIGGLGDFGFGVPQAKTQESKEAEEERNALKLREDDLDHIVDDLSDDERAQEQDLNEMFRREQEDQDRQQVKEVMRNVKEGFGRNRRAFSGLHSGSEARGRFNLDELVAADGSKFEAARLGLLESDEELSEGDDGKKKKKKVNADGEEVEEEEEEEEDEEAEMERMLRERFMNQPKIYVTSSESGSDDEEENEAKKDNGPDGDEVESDEERERQQMKLFSERARINRRMQRMTQFKQKATSAKTESSLGLLAYPVLMAADILLYRATHVPVGEDQQQHLELTRMIATTFNDRFGSNHPGGKEVLPKPFPMVEEDTATLTGAQTKSLSRIMSLRDPTKKMSKSDKSALSRIELTDTADDIRKKVRKATTDAVSGIYYDRDERPGVSNLLDIASSVTGQSVAQLEAQYAGYRTGDFKDSVADAVIAKICPIGDRIKQYEADQAYIDKVLADGAAQASELAAVTMKDVKEIMGLARS
ncbi:hypothetical protein ON010_g11377 [Phytophthora cinnamomi]|nr:hypothetical protein ON010_g11377 [Phytophthora cinnamomi]